MSNSPEFLAYCTEQGICPNTKIAQLFFKQGCRAVSFSPPAQKPASVPGGSGAGLAGNPSQILDFCDSLPVTMSGDAWESAALHILAMRVNHG